MVQEAELFLVVFKQLIRLDRGGVNNLPPEHLLRFIPMILIMLNENQMPSINYNGYLEPMGLTEVTV